MIIQAHSAIRARIFILKTNCLLQIKIKIKEKNSVWFVKKSEIDE